MQTKSVEPAMKELETTEQNDKVFGSEDDMKTSMEQLRNGDLYVIGRLWIEALRKVLVGGKFSFVPVVEAAPAKPGENTIPEKPPPMKYKDLSIYDSPHYEYKDYEADKKFCPNARSKLLHEYLYPKVRDYRKQWNDSVSDFMKEAEVFKKGSSTDYHNFKRDLKKIMRDPDNVAVRQAIVALSTVTGYYIGSFIGSGKGLPRKIFFAGLGALAAGSLCFPKETDEVFRNVSFQMGKMVVSFFNSACGHNIELRERLPCREELPPPPPARTESLKCDTKDKK